MLKLLTLFLYVQMQENHINLIDQKTENILLLFIYPFFADIIIPFDGFYHYLGIFLSGIVMVLGKITAEYIVEKLRKRIKEK